MREGMSNALKLCSKVELTAPMHSIKKCMHVKGESHESSGTPVQTSEGMNGICYHDFYTDNFPTYL